MKFPDAARGVKKLFTSEILKLIAVICIIGCAVSMLLAILSIVPFVDFNTGDVNTAGIGDDIAVKLSIALIAFLVFLLTFSVLIIISFIFKLIGLAQAARDESSFRGAIACILIEVVAVIVSGFFMTGSITGVGTDSVDPNSVFAMTSTMSIERLIFSLANLLIIIFVITGIIRLADQLNNGEISAKGNNLLKIIIVINLLIIIADVIALIFGSSPATAIVCGILLLAGLILEIIQYFLYLSLLSKASKMLANR